MSDPLVSILIVTYNAPEWAARCLDSVAAHTHEPREVDVVDNLSGEPTRRMLRERADRGEIRLHLHGANDLWAAGCNRALGLASPSSPLVLLLNPDCEVLRDDWIARMKAVLDRDPAVGSAGPFLNWKRVGPVFGSVDGSCMLLRRRALAEVGPLDAERYPWNGAPADWAARAYAKGWTYRRAPHEPPFLVHHGHKSQEDSGTPLPYRRVDHEEMARRAGLVPFRPRRLAAWWRRRFGPPFFFDPDAPVGAR